MRLQWLLLAAGLVAAIALGSVTTELDSAKGRERLGDRGAVDAPLHGSSAVRSELRAGSDTGGPDDSSAAALDTSALSAAPTPSLSSPATPRPGGTTSPTSFGRARRART